LGPPWTNRKEVKSVWESPKKGEKKGQTRKKKSRGQIDNTATRNQPVPKNGGRKKAMLVQGGHSKSYKETVGKKRKESKLSRAALTKKRDRPGKNCRTQSFEVIPTS